MVFQFFQVKKHRIDLYPGFEHIQNGEQPPALHWVLLSVAALEAIVWPVVFCCLPVERKSFCVRCILFLLLLLPGILGVRGGLSYDITAHFVIIPFSLLLCILGPARISLVPCVGPACIRLLFGRLPWRRRNPDKANAPNANGLPVPMDVPQDVPIDVQDEEHVPDEIPAEALSDPGAQGNTSGFVAEYF